jgi:putative heme-binding domain-containing protein
MLLHPDADIQTEVTKHFGPVEGATTEAMRAQVAKLAGVVASGTGDPYAGKKIYLSSCAKCHRLFEEGADIGPNLTSYQRDNFEAMLLNVVNPSAEIREGFETSIIITTDGQVLSGFIADQDDQLVVLRTADGQRQTVLREAIEEMRGSPRSIMPEKLLDDLDESQVRNLFAYLRSRQPLND